VEYLRERISEERDPLERLHRFVVEYHEACRPSPDGMPARAEVPPVMAEFAQQLLTQHPEEAARAFGPMVSMFKELFDQAAAARAVRSDLSSRRATGVVLEAIMFDAFSSTIGGASTRGGDRSAAEELWDLIYHGIGTGA
jgi:hypothetical protein